MRRAGGSVAGLLATAAVLAAGLLGPAATTAFAAPAAAPANIGPLPAAPATAPLTLRLNSMEPRIVTADGPTTVTVAGVLRNTGSTTVKDLSARLQRSDALRTEGQLRAAMSGDVAADAVAPGFTAVATELASGAETEVRLSVALRGSQDNSLALTQPGNYELLVNINGVVGDGGRSRITTARMLLPVLSLPGIARPAPAPGTAPGVSLLYPLADVPRRLSTGPGEGVVLADDELASSLDANGRLDGLLRGLEQRAPVGSGVRAGICVAVDPELLSTVALMGGGYKVQAGGNLVDGRGAAAAVRWLDALRAATKGTCVIALPMADADLVALSRGELAKLAGYAVQTGAQLASNILRTPVVQRATWPADGTLDDRALLDFTGVGGTGVVLSADAVSTGRSRSAGLVRLPGGRSPGQTIAPQAVLTDPLLGMSTASAQPAVPGAADPAGGQPSGSAPGLPAQDAVGALTFRATTAARTTAGAVSAAPQVLAPPHRWDLKVGEAAALLGGFDTLVQAGAVIPRSLGALLSAESPANTPEARLAYSSQAGGREVPATVINQLRATQNAADELKSAAENEPDVGTTPGQLFAPVTEGLLRSASASWRGQPELAAAAAETISARVEQLRSAVRVVEPPGPYSLASESAPLTLTVANGLPVAMNVRVELTGTGGLRTAPLGVQRVPPLGRLQVRVTAEVARSGQFTVYARVSTPGGSVLGAPSRLLVNSTAYGTITLWLTGTAGVLLVVLAGRRVIRRIRRRPGSGAGDGPLPLPPTTPPLSVPATPSPTTPSPTPSVTSTPSVSPSGPAPPR